jgi:hypothetical protein
MGNLLCYFLSGFGNRQVSVILPRYTKSHVIGSVSPNNGWNSQGYWAVGVFLGNSLSLLEFLRLNVLHNLLDRRSEVLLWYLQIWSDDFDRKLAVAR